jgi:hypothetical protein
MKYLVITFALFGLQSCIEQTPLSDSLNNVACIVTDESLNGEMTEEEWSISESDCETSIPNLDARVSTDCPLGHVIECQQNYGVTYLYSSSAQFSDCDLLN